MKLDVLIPVASKSVYIEEAIRSAKTQSLEANIYIVENNTGDKSYSGYLQSLADAYSVNYIFFEDRLPMFENWNRCMSVGESEWVAFLHDDDLWSPEYLKAVSQTKDECDIIFYEYKCFQDGDDVSGNGSGSYCVNYMKSREKLLAKMLYSNQHASSAVFKRELKLSFPVDYKMMGDQHAFRECIASHEHVKSAWIETDSPNMIRLQPNQATVTVRAYGAPENAASYRDFLRKAFSVSIDVDEFCRELAAESASNDLARLLGAIIFRHPYADTTAVVTRILVARKSIRLFAEMLFRAMLQEQLWAAKLFYSTK